MFYLNIKKILTKRNYTIDETATRDYNICIRQKIQKFLGYVLWIRKYGIEIPEIINNNQTYLVFY